MAPSWVKADFAKEHHMQALTLLRIQGHANHLANHRLHTSMRALSAADLQAPRTSFFPTLMGTLNHILEVDLYYIAVLHGQADADQIWRRFVPANTLVDLAAQQAASDQCLIHWLQAADDAALDRAVHMPRGGGRVQTDLAAHMLQHLFMHQTHHRGQVHAMLSGTPVLPPQLDEFLMPSEPHLRHAEMATLGWTEAAVYGHRAS
jgi:uncharacterized damage-inducible protein DinB